MMDEQRQRVWDDYFLEIADVVRTKSKDRSTQIGAVIVGKDKQIVSTGFNGFPRGINEEAQLRWARPLKYQFLVHAERNAIYNAARTGVSLAGCTLYVLGFEHPTVCSECARAIIQAGITRVVGKGYKDLPESWLADMTFASALLAEAGVEFIGLS